MSMDDTPSERERLEGAQRESRILNVLSDLRTEFATLRGDFSDLRTDFATFKGEVKDELHAMDVKIAGLPTKREMTANLQWTLATVIGTGLAILGAMLATLQYGLGAASNTLAAVQTGLSVPRPADTPPTPIIIQVPSYQAPSGLPAPAAPKP